MEFKLCTCRRKVNKITEVLKKLQKELGIKNNSAEFDFDLVFVEDSINDLLNLDINYSLHIEKLVGPGVTYQNCPNSTKNRHPIPRQEANQGIGGFELKSLGSGCGGSERGKWSSNCVLAGEKSTKLLKS
eukprot:TRINITY_DN8201_c0_g1_i1.p1 TRINITY_DN8201_c0_g1~~TRINITY_DN8201_c0_g1_i1.p1  ORF type:complete len:130 (-),score=17.98 TRINITY_DN8201_c0_g1_i1:82-471(-)